MIKEHESRRKYRDPETCCTPPLAEDTLWTNLDDDPMGVYTDLGGRSSPTTPPPLRALKLTYNETAEKILKALEDVKTEAFKVESTKEIELKEELASHDYAIKKFKNYKTEAVDPDWKPVKRPMNNLPRGHQKFASSMIMRPAFDRPCTIKCPGSVGIIPPLQCVKCKNMFHAKCQGVNFKPGMKEFRCRKCLGRQQVQQRRPLLPQVHPRGHQNGPQGNAVKLRLPMMPKNGKRPICELVLRTPEGRYQPIRFRNNSQITETIPRSLFHKANTARKTLYVKSQQLPRLNGRPVFLAINPGTAQPLPPIARPAQPQARPGGIPGGDQVSILVRPQKSLPTTKPVLLNVPRKVALKVKVGTTLSFSASNDQKYIVMDSKIHPPVGSRARNNQNTPPRPRLPPSLTVIPSSRPLVSSPGRGRGRGRGVQAHGVRGMPANRGGLNRNIAALMNNKRPGLTITRGPGGGPGPAKVPRMAPSIPKGASILASGEV